MVAIIFAEICRNCPISKIFQVLPRNACWIFFFQLDVNTLEFFKNQSRIPMPFLAGITTTNAMFINTFSEAHYKCFPHRKCGESPCRKVFPVISQRLLNRWTVQLDSGCTTGGVERVVSVHNST